MQNTPVFVFPVPALKSVELAHLLPISPMWMLPRLRAAAHFYGAKTVEPDSARVLDIGCGKGELALLTAQCHPQAEVVGICNTQEEWQQASEAAAAANVANARFLLLEQQGALQEIGLFDYVFLRNQYGFLDSAGQQAILSFIQSVLKPDGLACMDYPVYPGAKAFETVRDGVLMSLPEDQSGQLEEAAEAGLSLFKGESTTNTLAPATRQAALEFEQHMKEAGLDAALRLNESACYLVELAARLPEHGLACVGDADPSKDMGAAHSRHTAQVSQALALGRPELLRMQFLDIATGRSRRHALLAHVNRASGLPLMPSLERLRDLNWASAFQRKGNGESADGKVLYIGLGGKTLQATRPMMIALLDLLSHQWPASLSFGQIAKDPAILAARQDSDAEPDDELLYCLAQGFVNEILYFFYGFTPYDNAAGKASRFLPEVLQATGAMKHSSAADPSVRKTKTYNLYGDRVHLKWSTVQRKAVRALAGQDGRMRLFFESDDDANNKPVSGNILTHLLRAGVLQADREELHTWLKQALIATGYRGNYWVLFLSSVIALGHVQETQPAILNWTPESSQGVSLPPQAISSVGRLKELLGRKHYGQARQEAEHLLGRYPDLLIVRYALIKALHAEGKVQDALQHLPQFIELVGKDNADGWFLVAQVLLAVENYPGALMAAHRVSALHPKHTGTMTLMAMAFMKMLRHVEGVMYYRRALEQEPDSAVAHFNLSYALAEFGEPDEAVEVMLPCLEKTPDDFRIYGNLLYALNYSVEKSAEEIFEVYKQLEQAALKKYRPLWQAHKNRKRWNRRLKVAYVSGDFRGHAVAKFVMPLFKQHDHEAFEFTAYSNHTTEDNVTHRLKAYFDRWVSVAGMSDTEMVKRIRDDEIDILVDLSGHTGANRLPVFACKPAPVSATWLGFVYTTGLSAIDYILTDEEVAPQGSEHLFSERPWRLPGCNLIFQWDWDSSGEVSELPALKNGFVTFGTLTRSIRMNRLVVKTWARILKALPNSRLLINSSSYSSEEARNSLTQRFVEQGIDSKRLNIGFATPPWDSLRTVDIALDCFPHNSGTTLLDGFSMGIPYITLAGRPSVGRLGASLLRGLGRPEWIARNEDEYVDKAVALASDLPALAQIRAGLRDEIERSELADGAAFARKLEEAYREMFRIWCEQDEQ